MKTSPKPNKKSKRSPTKKNIVSGNTIKEYKKFSRKRLLFFAAAIVIVGVASLAYSFASVSTPTRTVEVESFQFKEDQTWAINPPGSTVASMWWTGSGTKNVTLPDRVTKISALAHGQQCDGAPKMEIKVDNKIIVSREVTGTTPTVYNTSVSIEPGQHLVTISFLNDLSKRQPNNALPYVCDRNLFVDSITFTSESYIDPSTSTADAAISTVPGSALSYGTSGKVVGSSGLIWNSVGSATGEFTLPSGTHTVVTTMRGEQCEGFPQVSVQIDNDVILSGNINAKTDTDYAVSKTLAAGKHTIKVTLLNDYKTTSCDRNLWLNKLTFRGKPAPPAPKGTVFDPTSFWNIPLPATTPVSSNTAAYIQSIKTDLKAYSGNGDIHTTAYTPPVYVAPANAPTVKFAFNNCQNRTYVPTDMLTQISAVPVPTYAQPSSGTDGEMVVYQPSTDTLWEVWRAVKTSSGWSACWGGRITNVSKSSGIFPGNYGVTASGVSFMGGLIRAEELKAGKIEHVVGISLINVRKGHVWPATRNDGLTTNPINPVEGTRMRIDPSVNLDTITMTPSARAIAKAAQKYGLVVWDRAGAVSFRAENASAFTLAGKANPYPPIFGSTPSYNQLAGFPWDKIQVLPDGYGQNGF